MLCLQKHGIHSIGLLTRNLPASIETTLNLCLSGLSPKRFNSIWCFKSILYIYRLYYGYILFDQIFLLVTAQHWTLGHPDGRWASWTEAVDPEVATTGRCQHQGLASLLARNKGSKKISRMINIMWLGLMKNQYQHGYHHMISSWYDIRKTKPYHDQNMCWKKLLALQILPRFIGLFFFDEKKTT